jgi:predicted kinase
MTSSRLTDNATTLIVFGGLPGTGKSTLARRLAAERRATYLRIDDIEQALRSSGMLAGEVGPAGYLVGYALAASNLRLGDTVVADSVNPIAITRDAWQRVAIDNRARCVEIEVICSNVAEHRRRVEARTADIAGLKLPSWEDVLRREYEPWDRPRLVIDTVARTVEDALAELRSRIGSA